MTGAERDHCRRMTAVAIREPSGGVLSSRPASWRVRSTRDGIWASWRSLFVLFVLAVPLATGCATHIPQAIRQAPTDSIAVAEAQRNPTSHVGRPVRWGGTILAVRNQPRATEIELLARPLRAAGEPLDEAAGQGRFLAEIPRFLDPAEYPEGRSLTLRGRLARVETRPVGEYPYRYPVVVAEEWYLWPQAPDTVYVTPHPFFHPWYDPWYFYGRRPWYHPW